MKKKDWNKLKLEEVKAKTKVKNFNKEIKNKNYLLKNINKYIDFKLRDDLKNIDQSSKKDMIFEILMSRFDILQKNRLSIISIFKSFKKTPNDFIILLPSFIDSIIMIAKNANVSTSGLLGRINIKGILIIYFSTFLIWIKDDTDSLEKTMNSLDQNLDKAEKLINYFK